MLAALITALVPSLKALFVAPPTGSSVHIKPAPDGLPPLDVLFETATFAGNACIPLGLVCLGSALARLRMPKPIRKAPLGAIMTFAILKVINPLRPFVFWTLGLWHKFKQFLYMHR